MEFDDIKLSIGDILTANNIRYRIIGFSDGVVSICRMDITTLQIVLLPYIEVRSQIRSGTVTVEKEVNDTYVDPDRMSDAEKDIYNRKKIIISKITDIYGPLYYNLTGKKPKPELEQIITDSNMTRPTVLAAIRNYLQSGLNTMALIDKRWHSSMTLERGQYDYNSKTGRPSKHFKTSGVVLNDQILSQFADALQHYKSGREQTVVNAYIYMLDKYYTTDDGKGNISGVDASLRPTLRQFRYYCNKHLSPEENDILKTSAGENRNANRLLLGSSRSEAIKPGWIVEADALEADFFIVSEIDSGKTVGRPIVYMMIDVYSSVITAFSVSYENNSLLGLTNLMMNLAEDKVSYTEKFGFEITRDMWPSCFIPHEIRCDRGSDFKSDKFADICNDLNIIRTLEPGGTGSMKGLIEQSFHQFQCDERPLLERKGLITKRYDSEHKQEAMLTIEDFTRLLIDFVITHNMKVITTTGIMSKDMLKINGFVPMPVRLWEYGCEKFGGPQEITENNIKQYYYSIMPSDTATISRRGICYKDLYYVCDDERIRMIMYNTGKNRKKIPVKIDPRDVGHIYLLHSDKLITAELNGNIVGNASFAGLTWLQYNEYYAKIKDVMSYGEHHNIDVRMAKYRNDSSIIANAEKPYYADSKNLRETRSREKQFNNHENRIYDRIADEVEQPQLPEPPKEEKRPLDLFNYDDYKQAMREYNERNGYKKK